MPSIFFHNDQSGFHAEGMNCGMTLRREANREPTVATATATSVEIAAPVTPYRTVRHPSEK
jgi:hypothetical protein